MSKLYIFLSIYLSIKWHIHDSKISDNNLLDVFPHNLSLFQPYHQSTIRRDKKVNYYRQTIPFISQPLLIEALPTIN